MAKEGDMSTEGTEQSFLVKAEALEQAEQEASDYEGLDVEDNEGDEMLANTSCSSPADCLPPTPVGSTHNPPVSNLSQKNNLQKSNCRRTPDASLTHKLDGGVGPCQTKAEKKARLHTKTHAKEQAKRCKACAQQCSGDRPPALQDISKKRTEECVPMSAPGFDSEQMCLGVDEAVCERNMAQFNWDGRTCHPIIDSQDCVVAVLAGRPRGSDWDGLMEEAASEIEQTRGQLPCEMSRRGDFPVANVGQAHGGGHKQPGNVCQQCFKHMLQTLLSTTGQWDCMHALWKWKPTLRQHFKKKSVFACCTINFGSVTVCVHHTDHANLVFGWFKTDEDFKKSATRTQLSKGQEDRKTRWKNGLEMFSKIGDLLKK
ncbi:hypothetical protein K435DRAFT_812772 [Dendrothele bispora CBS 962.96]|uniref:Uncharacterized protein n=1 Tax=Dendrothele bispora (strain CBS 962.96) TaxID=1314807 RepID=A0A4S8KN64_DENBC|nr:hypothetical protein K435DRAFT_812772 [Dendrothele bispora CBS 962.96]